MTKEKFSLSRIVTRRFRSLTAILVISVFALHCSDDGVSAFNLFSDQDDVNLGKQVDAEIRADPAQYPILQGRPDVKAYVKTVGDKVLNSPDIKKRGVYAYEYEIIKDDKTVNAFCTPGGYIYVYTGLLKFIDNEATLAGILGHEIAHAERRHASQRMTQVYGVQILLGVLLGNNPSQLEEIGANLLTGLALLKNGRDQESESDKYSFDYLDDTEYYPGAIKYFFEKIIAQEESQPSAFETLLSTHPAPGDRISEVEQRLQEHGTPAPTEANLFAQRFQAFQATLP